MSGAIKYDSLNESKINTLSNLPSNPKLEDTNNKMEIFGYMLLLISVAFNIIFISKLKHQNRKHPKR